MDLLSHPKPFLDHDPQQAVVLTWDWECRLKAEHVGSRTLSVLLAQSKAKRPLGFSGDCAVEWFLCLVVSLTPGILRSLGFQGRTLGPG